MEIFTELQLSYSFENIKMKKIRFIQYKHLKAE